MNDDIGKTVKLFLFWCFLYFAPIIIGTIVGRIYKNDAIIGWTMLLACLFIIFVFFGKRYVKLSFDRIERRMVWPVVGVTLLIAVAFVFVEHSVYALLDVYRLFSDETEQGNDFSQRFFAEILGILYGGIFGPIAEEIGFRGVLLGGLLKTRCRPWLAILISALVFGLLHGIGVHFFGAMLFGIMVGWLYWRTGSIIPGIIIHVVNNSLSFIDLNNQPHTICLIILIVCLLLLAYGLWWFGKKCNFAGEVNQDLPKV